MVQNQSPSPFAVGNKEFPSTVFQAWIISAVKTCSSLIRITEPFDRVAVFPSDAVK